MHLYSIQIDDPCRRCMEMYANICIVSILSESVKTMLRLPFPSLFSDIQHLALKLIGLAHHSQGSNTIEEDITVRAQVTDWLSATLSSYSSFW